MASTKSGAELFEAIEAQREADQAEQNVLLHRTRVELLGGEQAAWSHDVRKVAVALWGSDALDRVETLLTATRRLQNVAGEPIVARSMSNRLHIEARKLHKLYEDEENASSWRFEVSGSYGNNATGIDEERAAYTWKPLPRFIVSLVAKCQSISEPSDLNAESPLVLWNDFTPCGQRTPEVTEFAVGLPAIIQSEMTNSTGVAQVVSQVIGRQ